MSGHSKWHSIKHQKGIADARRGQAFTKLAKMVTVAAKQGGPNPDMNFKLRLAIAKAKQGNMPNSNIDRAIAAASGSGKDSIEEIVYEGYAPGGVAILMEVATDNRNRSASEVRSTLTKNGGSLGESGSVSWQFESKGVLSIDKVDDDSALELIDAGAIDVTEEEPVIIYTKPGDLEMVKAKAEELGLKVENASVELVPKQKVKITDQAQAAKLFKLIEMLEELDDVTNVYANYEMDDAVFEQAMK